MRAHTNVIARNEAISELCQLRYGGYFKKRLPHVLVFLVFLMLSLNSLGQKRDSTKADSSHVFAITDAKPVGKTKPLIVVNGKIYKRSLKSIDTSQIKEVAISKGKAAMALYGRKGENGVILITTK